MRTAVRICLRRTLAFQSGMSEVRLVLCSFPDIDAARSIGTHLVEQQLAACVNFIHGVESVYRWQGQIESAQEVLAIIKTDAATLPTLMQTLESLHPYECPEVVAIAPDAVSEPYAAWLNACLKGRPAPDA